MKMPNLHATTATLAALLTGAPTVCGAEPPEPFTPPGPNIALNKPYTLEPAPNYGDCSLDPERKLLTDGVHTEGYFWVQKTTVGWVHVRPVAISIDLGKVEPIAGLSFSTAAGVAGVTWPTSMRIMVGDDGENWTAVGDLALLSNKRGAPAPAPYSLHRFATGELQTRGRYVSLVVDQTPYMVVDEVEVYGGPEALLERPPQGRQFTGSPLEICKERQLVDMVQWRMQADLGEITRALDGSNLTAEQKAAVRARAETLGQEISAYERLPKELTTILPLNELHARVYALQAPLLRARGYKGLTVWSGYRYDPLQPLQAPEARPATPVNLDVRMMRNERRAEVLNLTNATDSAVAATVRANGVGRPASYVTLRKIIYTDTSQRTPVGTALSRAEEKRLEVTVPAGTTVQVWVDLDSEGLAPGDYKVALQVNSGANDEVTVPLSVHVADLTMPEEFSIAIGGWDETNNRGGYDVTAENMVPLIRNLREHGVNMPWSNPQVVPTPGEYDEAGKLIKAPDFSSWDEWVERWKGARHWGVFANFKTSFAGEPIGTARFGKMVGAWATAWVEHAAGQGIRPEQIKLLILDEPRTDAQDQTIVAWSKALHAAQPELVVWNDPIHPDPTVVDPEFWATSDVLSPNTTRFLAEGKRYQDFYAAQREAGRELWFYSCSGPAKLLDPASYWRGQFWLNIKYGGKGSCFWAFGDEAGNSWNAYLQPRPSFSPLFLSNTTVTDAKQMEAIREGAEDYELFVMLRQRVEELEGRGMQNALLARAKELLVAGPDRAVAIMGPEKQQWMVGKDRTVMDRVRLEALEALERLSKL